MQAGVEQAQGGRGAVWAAPWGPGAALDAVAARCAAAGGLVVGPPPQHLNSSIAPTLSFPRGDATGLAVAAAALRDRFGRLDGLMFVLPEALRPDLPAAAAVELLTALEGDRAALGPGLPWLLVLPDPSGVRAGAAAALALEGAARGLAAAAQAAGSRGMVVTLPRAVWVGAPLSPRAALRLDRALAGGALPWLAQRLAARARR